MAEREERRHATRIAVNLPTLIEGLPHREADLHPNLAAVYQRVLPSPELVGEKFVGVIRDLSTNGCFIAGQAAPLLSRIAFTFGLDGYGQVDALGWVLWRRTGDCEIPRQQLDPVFLPAGFGVLFEAIPLEARQIIAKMGTPRGAN
jgi:hypothetical protein